MRELFQPKLPESQKRHILQVLTEKTKIDRYKECLAVGEHEGSIVRGHLIPHAWLRKISLEGEVMAFMTLPIVGTKALEGDGSFGLQPVSANTFNRRCFTCKKHEVLFHPIDIPDADLFDLRNLNLLVYKSIIATLWSQKLLMRSEEAALSETPENEMFKFGARLYSQSAIGLEYYKRQVERCLDPQTCSRCEGRECKTLAHKVLHIRGEPALAVSDFTSGARRRDDYTHGTITHLANWGLTVRPDAKGHTVVFHYFREEQGILQPDIEQLSRLQGRHLQEKVSCLILDHFENIAISPAVWERFGRRRNAILERFYNEVPNIGFGSAEQIAKWERDRFDPHPTPPNLRQLNLFSTKMR